MCNGKCNNWAGSSPACHRGVLDSVPGRSAETCYGESSTGIILSPDASVFPVNNIPQVIYSYSFPYHRRCKPKKCSSRMADWSAEDISYVCAGRYFRLVYYSWRPDTCLRVLVVSCIVIKYDSLVHGAQIFQVCRSHLKILGPRSAIWSKFLIEDPPIWGATIQNLVAMATSHRDLCIPLLVVTSQFHWSGDAAGLCLVVPRSILCRDSDYPD
jgi:hypothetical protein